MKILFLSNTFGALANFRFDLIKSLVQRGDSVYLAYPFGMDIQQQDMENSKVFEDWGCQFADTQMRRRGVSIKQDIKLMLSYRKLYKHLCPDIVLSYTIKPNIYGALTSPAGVPFLMSITGLGSAMEHNNLLAKILKTLYRCAINRATRVFVQNEGNAAFLRLPKGKGRLVPGSGVNLQRFLLLPYPGPEKVSFLFVARVMWEKGIDLYLTAAREIRSRYPNTEFHVVGSCDDVHYQSKLESMQKEDIIIFHGQQKDMVSFQTVNSCAVHPSFYPEGMSNVLLEAAASGRPIITTDRSGCREIVEEGITGYICRQQDSVDLILQIEKFLALSWEQRRDMGLAGRMKIEREFDRANVVLSYINEIDICFNAKRDGVL